MNKNITEQDIVQYYVNALQDVTQDQREQALVEAMNGLGAQIKEGLEALPQTFTDAQILAQ